MSRNAIVNFCHQDQGNVATNCGTPARLLSPQHRDMIRVGGELEYAARIWQCCGVRHNNIRPIHDFDVVGDCGSHGGEAVVAP